MTTSYTEVQKLFKERMNNPLLNTSYPLSPTDWMKYAAPGELPFDSTKPIAIYIHIPFCKQICSFCEYTKMCVPSINLQRNYINGVICDIERFTDQYPEIDIYGFDIGGGTPTSLDSELFESFMCWLHDYMSSINVTNDFEPSIEGSFDTLADDYHGHRRISSIAKAGINRISLGVQSTSNDVLRPLHRNVISLKEMHEAMDYWHRLGITKINLDLMYGLPGQTLGLIRRDIATIRELNPEQVTVYEFRTNQINSRHIVNLGQNYDQYCELYDGLTGLGYYGEFGRNTFSRNEHNFGVSSYLRHRMFDGWQYKGFGISAQSMSQFGVSYNVGKNQSIAKLISNDWLQDNRFSYEATQYYRLPAQELFGKFIAISGYSGGFSLSSAKEIFGSGFDVQYKFVLDFLIAERFIEKRGDRIQITREGFMNYGAILSLFHTPQ